MTMINELSRLSNDLPQQSNVSLSFDAYPLEKWCPTHCGTMDLVIKKDGHWWHNGCVINREALVLLFSKILCKENDSYYLKTPIEKIEISVEDAPFIIVGYEIFKDETNTEIILLKTNIGDKVPLSAQYPLRLRGAENKPYIILKRGLEAVVNRAVFYDLIDLALTQNNHSNDNELWLRSGALTHLLGKLT